MNDIQPTTSRLDEAMVARGLAPSRSRARDAVLRGHVRVAGKVVTKPAKLVDSGCTLEIDDPAQHYVSRSALKLVAGLDAFGFDPTGRTAVDLGASTGGFTQVLLERGARRVFAIDVGHGQLRAKIGSDPRVVSLEGLNARDLEARHLDGAATDLLVCDVSFISIRLALPPILDLMAPGAGAVILVKPQFEIGREGIGKNGLVAVEDGRLVANQLADWMAARPDWRCLGLIPSPIEGGDGNREYLMGAEKVA